MARPKPRDPTRGHHHRLALIFDFDLTLAPATVNSLLERIGIDDVHRWEREVLDRYVEDGWDKLIAHGPALIETAKRQGVELTRELVEQVGRDLEPFAGVEDTLDCLREVGREASGGADVELYVLSSGFVEIMGSSRVASRFDSMWGSAFHWSEEGPCGCLLGVKRTVIHSEKARYLLALAKGLDMHGADEPEDVHVDKPLDEWHLPLDQMIYVGDGESDLSAFELMHEHGGVAIGVDHSPDGEWQVIEHIYDAARVDCVAPPHFEPEGELHRSLCLAVESVGKRVALRRARSQGESRQGTQHAARTTE